MPVMRKKLRVGMKKTKEPKILRIVAAEAGAENRKMTKKIPLTQLEGLAVGRLLRKSRKK